VLSYIDLAKQEGGVFSVAAARPSRGTSATVQGRRFSRADGHVDLDVHCRVNQEEIFGPWSRLRIPHGGRGGPPRQRHAVRSVGLPVDARPGPRPPLPSAWNAATVWVNCWLLRDLRTPFGGVKQSGIGREGGDEALRFFTEPKTVCIKYECGRILAWISHHGFHG